VRQHPLTGKAAHQQRHGERERRKKTKSVRVDHRECEDGE
jgi:hypothetical protein